MYWKLNHSFRNSYRTTFIYKEKTSLIYNKMPIKPLDIEHTTYVEIRLKVTISIKTERDTVCKMKDLSHRPKAGLQHKYIHTLH